ncbi:hypothetical protein JD844_034220 [Phrynosoma platyrhinos]|uniref:Uncharacterized protein n=1 Tax=Phrynosoma platyrhinos TaxID=52577 RepID=A0ABQ7T896_PHRPL|nr:hypothetical protein JD844_034220 [Phrynosoma platyrhinos]
MNFTIFNFHLNRFAGILQEKKERNRGMMEHYRWNCAKTSQLGGKRGVKKDEKANAWPYRIREEMEPGKASLGSLAVRFIR